MLVELVAAYDEDRDAHVRVRGPDGERVVTVPRALVAAAIEAVQ